MITIRDVEDHIAIATNIKVVACLKLAGFQTVVDYLLFTDQTVDLIEKYVGRICKLLPLEQRYTYIDSELFAQNPSNFLFSVPIRMRLLSSVSDIICKYHTSKATEQKPVGTVESAVEVSNESHADYTGSKFQFEMPTIKQNKSPSSSEKSEDYPIKSESVIRPNCQAYQLSLESICPQEIIDIIPDNCKEFYVQIAQMASEEFIQCYLKPLEDYEISIFDNAFSDTIFNAKYTCLICDFSRKKSIKVKVKEMNNTIAFSKIKEHLKIHFALNPYVSDIRKQNNQMKKRNQRQLNIDTPIKKPVVRKRAHQYVEPPYIKKIIDTGVSLVDKEPVEPEKKKLFQILNEIIPRQNPVLSRSSVLKVSLAAKESVCDPTRVVIKAEKCDVSMEECNDCVTGVLNPVETVVESRIDEGELDDTDDDDKLTIAL